MCVCVCGCVSECMFNASLPSNNRNDNVERKNEKWHKFIRLELILSASFFSLSKMTMKIVRADNNNEKNIQWRKAKLLLCVSVVASTFAKKTSANSHERHDENIKDRLYSLISVCCCRQLLLFYGYCSLFA